MKTNILTLDFLIYWMDYGNELNGAYEDKRRNSKRLFNLFHYSWWTKTANYEIYWFHCNQHNVEIGNLN